MFTAWLNSSTFKRLFLFLIVAFSISIIAQLNTKISFIIIAITFLSIVCFILPINVLLYLLFFTASIDISPITIYDTYLRPWQIIATIIILKSIPLFKKIKLTKLMLLVLLMFIIFLPSIPYVKDMSGFLVLTFGQLLLSLTIIFVAIQLNEKDMIDKYYKVFQYGIYFIIFFGLIQWIGYHIPGGTLIFGMPKASFAGYIRPRSLLNEPDWYGVVCLIGFFMSLGKMVRNKKFYFCSKYNIFLIICSIALILSAVRAAILGVAIGTIIFFIIKKINLLHKFKMIFISFYLIIFLAILVMSIIKITGYNTLLDRLNPYTTYNTNIAAITSRKGSLNLAWDMFKKHPIVGNGAGSLGYQSGLIENWLLYNNGQSLTIGRGNVNLFMTTLADSGLIGLIVLLIFIMSLLSIKNTGEFEYLTDLKVILFSCLVSFQFSNGFREGFIWIMLVFMVAIDRYNKLHLKEDITINEYINN
ncbi:O-antigen ligase family protein [Thermoanaerobacterium thermosaccharolyticum]|uniref:O-antigen ligase family protein n=1 Tax=Thermoanaerobacterium thermosaccharolyticum TaxID=1517 RepID=UPI003DA9EFCF